MSFRTKRVSFITPFYMLFEFFLLKYICLLFGEVDDIHLLIITVILGLIHFLPMFFEAHKSRRFTRALTVFNGVWMWASVMFFFDLIVIYLIGSFITLPSTAIISLLAIVPILGIYNYWKAHKIVINERTLIFNNLKRDINIAHLSDVHFGSVCHKKTIINLKDKLNELDCELVIISGDLADGSSVVEENDFIALKDVKIPVIFTPGNHDYYPGIEDVILACKKAGIIVLNNESIEFEGLNIYGQSYSVDDVGIPQIDGSVIKSDMLNIINYHVPYYWDDFSNLGFDIQLSGHTHGGQFYPVVWIGNLIFKYNMGLFKNDLGKYLHVTTGVGSMDTPMRWGTDSEIVILKLRNNI